MSECQTKAGTLIVIDIAQEYPTLQCLCDIEQESMWHWDVSNITGSAFIVGM